MRSERGSGTSRWARGGGRTRGGGARSAPAAGGADAYSGSPVKRIPIGLQGDIKPCVRFSPDGKLLVSGSKAGGIFSRTRLFSCSINYKYKYQLVCYT